MSHQLTLVAAPSRGLSSADLSLARDLLAQKGAVASGETWLSEGVAADLGLSLSTGTDPADLAAHLAPLSNAEIDFAILPAETRRKSVLIADMDSTMIEIETLDTLAAAYGFGEEVMRITERSMNGDLDFAASLRERVALLKGIPAEDAFEKVMSQVTYTPGGTALVKTMRANGAYCALVSGGFTFTTEIVHARIGFDTHHANILEAEDGQLTGTVREPVLSRDSKLTVLKEICDVRGLPLSAACTVGDGANDLDMLQAAGLGVAYRGKPIVRANANFRIDHTDLTTLLYFQGYSRESFVSDT